MREFYNTTKKLSARYQLTEKPIKDKEGKTLTSAEEQLKRWVKHFSELLNRPAPEDPPDIPPAKIELPINCGKPTRQEIRNAVQSLKDGRAAGPDDFLQKPLRYTLAPPLKLSTDYLRPFGTGRRDSSSNCRRKEI